jgi:hypothetical protein
LPIALTDDLVGWTRTRIPIAEMSIVVTVPHIAIAFGASGNAARG